MIVPLDTAHEILATFGITRPSHAYERWVKPEGFELGDFWAEVLAESQYIFGCDWRDSLCDELELVVAALGNLGVALHTEELPDDMGCSAFVKFEDRKVFVRYVPNDDQTSWLAVFHALQSVLPDGVEFRESVDNGESDTDVYAVLQKDEWHRLDTQATEAVEAMFRPLSLIGNS